VLFVEESKDMPSHLTSTHSALRDLVRVLPEQDCQLVPLLRKRVGAFRGSLLQVSEELIDAFVSVMQERHAQLAFPLHLSQHAHQHRPQRPVPLAVDQKLGKKARLDQELGDDAVGVGIAKVAERDVRLAWRRLSRNRWWDRSPVRWAETCGA
jgi:hypothetical protein